MLCVFSSEIQTAFSIARETSTEKPSVSSDIEGLTLRDQLFACADDQQVQRGEKIRSDSIDVDDGQVQNPNGGQHGFIRLGEVDLGAPKHVENALCGGKIVRARVFFGNEARQFGQIFA